MLKIKNRIISSNYSVRNNVITGCIVHSAAEYIKINNEFKPAWNFFNDPTTRGSYHILIYPDGKAVRLLPDDLAAWHAGVSEWRGKRNLNQTTVGICFLVEGQHDWVSFTNAIKKHDTYRFDQYYVGGYCIVEWIKRHGFSIDMVLGHSQVSGPGVRKDPKIDPGDGFSWATLKTQINRHTATRQGTL